MPLTLLQDRQGREVEYNSDTGILCRVAIVRKRAVLYSSPPFHGFLTFKEFQQGDYGVIKEKGSYFRSKLSGNIASYIDSTGMEILHDIDNCRFYRVYLQMWW